MVIALRDFANRFPRLKRVARTVLAPFLRRSVSSHYVELKGKNADDESQRLRNSWKESSLPAQQRRLVDQQLSAFHRGEPVDNFDVIRRALSDMQFTTGPVSLLEIGCSSGYYSEITSSVSPGFAYSGCDYSVSFIDLARSTYPALDFRVEDTTDLSYEDDAFDVVVSGCCLLHVPDYPKGVSETARVARNFAVFHRTPVMIGQPEKVFRKLAYGVETVEIHVNEPSFLVLLREHGLETVASYTLSETVNRGIGTAVRTYVCRKVTT